MDNLFKEFRRRNIFRVAGMYFIVGWFLLQLAALFENSLNLPSWFDTFITVMVILGLPVALILAWAFEMTPEGVKPTEKLDPNHKALPERSHKIDFVLVALLGVIVMFFVGERFLSNSQNISSENSSNRSASVNDGQKENPQGTNNSLAVLPFVDLSEKGDQGYFSDGIAEELLNALAQVSSLDVAGRTSSFAFKGKDVSLKDIGEILNVSHVLEGSVRKSGTKIRVSAKLISISTGFQRWASTYDRELDDIFAVQDEISQSIVTELTPHFRSTANTTGSTKTLRGNLDAYDLYLHAKKIAAGGTFESYQEAATILDRALAIDPTYVPALAWRGYYQMMISDAPGFQGVSGVHGVPPVDEAIPVALNFVEKALELEPNSPDALFARATIFSVRTEDTEKAERDYRQAIKLKPNFPLAKNDLAVLLESQLKSKEAFELFEEALAHDPGLVDANFNLFQGYFWQSRFPEAQKVLDNWGRISPHDQTRRRLEAQFAFDTGEIAKGMKMGESILADAPDSPQIVRFLASGWLSLGEYSKVLLSAYDQHHPFALSGLGEKKAGRDLAEKYIKSRPDNVDQQQVYMNFLFLEGQWDDLTAYYEDTYGSVKDLKDSDSYPPLEQVAAALVATNHPHAKELISVTRKHIEQQRDSNITLAILDYEEAVLLIIEGRPDLALSRLKSAYDKGSYDLHIKLNPVYNRLSGIDGYDKLVTETENVINAERAKIGLGRIALPE